MNKRILMWVVCGFFLSSCSDWLDVMPKESIEETDLFKKATGFQNALNGVYEQMSSTELYGRELTFGMLDAMGQVYFLEGESWYVNYNIKSYHHYYQAAMFDYKANNDIKGAFNDVWSKAYNTIANCNNIINKIGTLKPEDFRLGEVEREMIKGEAMAARALLHFDLLRLFAPAPSANPTGIYIPYVLEFPYYGGKAALTVEETMKKIEEDLLAAKALIMAYDTLNLAHRYALAQDVRFATSQTGISGADGSSVEMLPFYHYRGYRINGLAVTALLARFYSYWGGDKHKLAAENAKEVLEFLAIPEQKILAVEYTKDESISGNWKFRNDLIFCLSYPTLLEDYATYSSTKSNSSLTLKYENIWIYDLADGGDCRKKYLIKSPEVSDWYQNYWPLKNIKPSSGSDKLLKETEDMVPMIRLSEMHFVLAEYYASINDFKNAAENIKKVRVGRNCGGEVDLGIKDIATFKARLLGEVRREFFQEGQTFFYYKKYGEKLTGSMNPDSFVVPTPDSENIN